MKTSDNSHILIIVLSGNYSTGLGLVRSLGAAGYTVDLISAVKRKGSSVIASSSKYVRRSQEVFLTSDTDTDRREILSRVSAYRSEDKATKILVPADDRMSYLLDLYKDELSGDFIIAGRTDGGEESLGSLMDKAVQGRYAEAYGIRRPEEWVLDLAEDEIPEDMIYPCFVKPLKSIEGDKTEMARAGSSEELRKILDKLKREDSARSVLVQRFLDVDKEYDIGGICLDDKVFIPGVIEKIRIARFERGVTMAGKMVSCDVLGEMLGKVMELMSGFHYTGLFDLELILSEGKLYLNEINFRAGGPNYAYTLNGVDLPALLIDGIINGITEFPAEDLITGRTFVYEKVAWEEYIQGFFSKKELNDTLNGADLKLLDNADDPEPGRIFGRRIRLSLLKHRILKH